MQTFFKYFIIIFCHAIFCVNWAECNHGWTHHGEAFVEGKLAQLLATSIV